MSYIGKGPTLTLLWITVAVLLAVGFVIGWLTKGWLG